MNKIMKKDLLK